MSNHQILFDKLVYIDRLKRAGISEDQARAHAEAMDEALRETIVTKQYFDSQLQIRLAQLETKLTLRTGTMIAAAVAVLIGVKFLA